MTNLLLMSVIFVVLPLLLGGIVMHLGRRAESVDDTAVSSWMESIDRELSYLPLQRLLAGGDIEFLREQPGFNTRLERRFIRERRGVVLTYLRQMHRNFDLFSRLCRNLVPHSPNPGFAVLVVERTVLFHLGYAMLMISCRVGSPTAARASFQRLGGAIADLRREGEHRWALTAQRAESWASATMTAESTLGA